MRWIILLMSSLSFWVVEGQKMSEVEHLGRLHFKVETKNATYLYDPIAGGFSSILDKEGLDWISYKDEPWGEYPASAASAFRGLPNLVHGSEDAGAGHPGHRKCRSRVEGERQIVSETLSGRWQWRWTFDDCTARLDILKIDPEHAYWFLYEGTPGGRYQVESLYWGHEEAGPIRRHYDHFKGDKYFAHHQWLYFGDDSVDRCFIIAQLEVDEEIDHYSLLGNSKAGMHSPDGMVVAGLGRMDPAKPMLRKPHSFVIGLYERAVRTRRDGRRLRRYVKRRMLKGNKDI